MPHVTTWERTEEKRGEKKGEKIGERKEKLETARRMLNDDMPIDRIIKYTGLTEEEITIPRKSWWCAGKNVDNCNNMSHNIPGGNKVT